jgi:hypothetical protein
MILTILLSSLTILLMTGWSLMGMARMQDQLAEEQFDNSQESLGR